MIYPLVILFIIILWYNISIMPDSIVKDKQEKKFSIIILTVIVVISALRADSVGADTIGYRGAFNNMPYFQNLSELQERYGGYLGYYIPCKFVSLLNLPVQVWFAIVQSFYLYTVYKFIERYSKDKIFSILVFFTIGLYGFSVAGLKQTVANSWAILAFLAYIDKKYIHMIIYALLAYSCHSCTLIFAGAFGLYIIRNTKFFALFILFFIITSYFFADYLLIQMVAFLNEEHFESYLEFENSYKATTLIFYIVLVCLCCYTIKAYKLQDKDVARYSLGLCLLACGLQALASVSSNAFRLAYFYTPFFMVLIPNTCYFQKRSIKTNLKIIYAIILIFYFLYSNRNNPYEFYFFSN